MQPLSAAAGAALALFLGYALIPDAMERRSPSSLRRGPAGTGGVALTFDDGPHPELTPKVLDHLAAARAHATFFVVGEHVRRYPEIVARAVREGHALGVHTDTHRHAWVTAPGRLRAEVDACLEAIAAATGGGRPLWFRPPWGAFNATTRPIVASRRLHVALWSCDAGDWLPGAGTGAIAGRVRRGLQAGAIIDLHDGGQTPAGCAAMTEALPDILGTMDERGLRAIHLGEFFGLPALVGAT